MSDSTASSSRSRGVRGLLLGASATAVLQATSSGIGFLVAIILARTLGGQRYGVYAFALAWVSVLAIPAGLGLYRFVVRGVAVYDVNERWPELRGLLVRANSLVLGASTLIAIGGAAVALVALTSSRRWVFVIAMLLVPLNALTLLRQGTMQAFGRIVSGQVPEYVIRPVILVAGIGVLALLSSHNLTPTTAMIVNVVGVAVAFCVGATWLNRTIPERVHVASPSYRTREWVAAALPMMLLAAIWQLSGYVSTIALGVLVGTRDVGIYNVVEKGSEIIVLLLVAANMPLAPAVARMHAQGDLSGLEHAAERVAQVTLAASLPVAAVFLVVPSVYLDIFGHGFVAGATALRVLAGAQLLNAAAGPVGSVLIMTGHERAASMSVGAGLLLTVVLSVILIPELGVVGAAIADGVSFVVWNVSMNVICRRRLGINATALPLLSLRSPIHVS